MVSKMNTTDGSTAQNVNGSNIVIAKESNSKPQQQITVSNIFSGLLPCLVVYLVIGLMFKSRKTGMILGGGSFIGLFICTLIAQDNRFFSDGLSWSSCNVFTSAILPFVLSGILVFTATKSHIEIESSSVNL